MKNNYITYIVIGALVGVEAWFFGKVFVVPIFGYILDYLSFPFLSVFVVAGVESVPWRFATLLVKDVLVFALYGYLIASVIKSTRKSLKVISALVLILMVSFGPIAAGLEALWEYDCDTQTRYQTPVEREYTIKEVMFQGAEADVMLAGEWTIPFGDGPFPGVVLISGSEPTDRNSFILGHYPFLVLADYLTNKGYAVLRYDVRGYGESTGNLHSTVTDDFAADSAEALRWLRAQENIDVNRVGFIGHSEGATKGLMAAQIEKPNFMIFIAGGLEGAGELLLRQGREIAQAGGAAEELLTRAEEETRKVLDIVTSGKSTEEVRNEIEKMVLGEGMGIVLAERVSKEITKPWYINFFKGGDSIYEKIDTEAADLIKNYNGPILALYGGKDLLVSSKIEVPLVAPLLTNAKSKIIVLPGLNHFMQPVPEDGYYRDAVIEACDIETTFDPKALQIIGDWLESIDKDIVAANNKAEDSIGADNIQNKKPKESSKMTNSNSLVMVNRDSEIVPQYGTSGSKASLQIVQTIPSRNDPFSFSTNSQGPLSISDDILTVNVEYGGGCAEHDFSLMWDEKFLEMSPVQADLSLIHNSNDDGCFSHISKTLSFDLTPLRNSYMRSYQTSSGEIIMFVSDADRKMKSVTYTF